MEYIRHPNISANQFDRVRRELDEGEQVVLMAPLKSNFFTGANIFLLCFGAVWTSVSLILLSVSIMGGKNDTSWVAILFVSLFVLVGLALMFTPFYMVKKAVNTIVAFTEKRVIVSTAKDCSSAFLRDVKRISYVEYLGKNGHIMLGIDSIPDGLHIRGSYDAPDLVLASLPEVKSIDQILRRYCRENAGEHGVVESVQWDSESLDRETKMMIEAKLEPGESLIWAQKPLCSKIWLWLMAVFSAVTLFVVVVLFVISMLRGPAGDAPWFFIVLIVGCLVLVDAIIFRGFYRATKVDKSSCYIVTNKRAAIFRRLTSDQFEAVNFLPPGIEILQKTRRNNGCGNLVFYQVVRYGKHGDTIIDKGFMKTPDVDLAEQAVKNLINATPRDKTRSQLNPHS